MKKFFIYSMIVTASFLLVLTSCRRANKFPRKLKGVNIEFTITSTSKNAWIENGWTAVYKFGNSYGLWRFSSKNNSKTSVSGYKYDRSSNRESAIIHFRYHGTNGDEEYELVASDESWKEGTFSYSHTFLESGTAKGTYKVLCTDCGIPESETSDETGGSELDDSNSGNVSSCCGGIDCSDLDNCYSAWSGGEGAQEGYQCIQACAYRCEGLNEEADQICATMASWAPNATANCSACP